MKTVPFPLPKECFPKDTSSREAVRTIGYVFPDDRTVSLTLYEDNGVGIRILRPVPETDITQELAFHLTEEAAKVLLVGLQKIMGGN